MGVAGKALDDLGHGFGFILGFAGSVYLKFIGKVRFVYFNASPNRIEVIASPGTQVAATRAEKSSPIGPKWPRGGKSDGSGQSSVADRFGFAVGAMLTTGKQPRLKSSRKAKSI